MKVIVIGGGASGMLASIIAAREGNQVIVLEKTASLGNKIKITGKGRCNVTFAGDIEDFKRNVVKNEKFMYSSFTKFDNKDVVHFFEDLGVNMKEERGARIFPQSDCAEDIVSALTQEMKKYSIQVLYHARVVKLHTKEKVICSVELEDGRKIMCDKCIIATGGKSYQKTGSSGDGYALARSIGHKIIEIRPGLVPLRSQDNLCKRLQGLSLRNISLSILEDGNSIYQQFGEMMFAHFGITGPIVLSASSKVNRIENMQEKMDSKKIVAVIDLKPALDLEVLDKRICRDFEKYSNKEFKNSLNDLLPQKLIPEIIQLSGIGEEKKVHQISKVERMNLAKIMKNLPVTISGLMPLEMAIITCGGIDVKEISPKTMESKLIKGLHFVGEVLDIDAYTGGYNLQIAFSTAFVAGKNE